MMKKESFFSKIFNKEVKYYLLGLDKKIDHAYILYVQDGKDYVELGSLEKTYQKLLQMYPKITSRLIMVMIHPGDSVERWHTYHHKGKYFEKYVQFMNEEFIHFVEEKFSVPIVKRGLLGDSLGGNISLNIACKNPNQWTHLLLQSAAVSTKDIDMVEMITVKIPWKIYQTVGIYEDSFVSTITNEKLFILTRNRLLNQTLLNKGALVQYVEQNEKHEWVFWKRDLLNALTFFVFN